MPPARHKRHLPSSCRLHANPSLVSQVTKKFDPDSVYKPPSPHPTPPHPRQGRRRSILKTCLPNPKPAEPSCAGDSRDTVGSKEYSPLRIGLLFICTVEWIGGSEMGVEVQIVDGRGGSSSLPKCYSKRTPCQLSRKIELRRLWLVGIFAIMMLQVAQNCKVVRGCVLIPTSLGLGCVVWHVSNIHSPRCSFAPAASA